jgi:SAM-dependent methyltransferase
VTGHRCPACGSGAVRIFHTEPSVPAHSCLLLRSQEEAAAYPRGTLRLGFCEACGFITNTAFDVSLNEYSSRYEETQAFSERFTGFARELAREWVDRYDLRGRRVLEIGCGKGEFLTMMCEEGVAEGIGIDPGTNPDRVESEAGGRITWITDLYSESYGSIHADAIVCRHTLEHIHPVADFMRTVRRSIGDRLDTVVLFELPDALRVLQEVAFWDVYYEHSAYFSAGSLARLFRSTGFEVVDLRLAYDDQYLLIEARPSTDTPAGGRRFDLEDDLEEVRKAVDRFAAEYEDQLERWRGDLRRLTEVGERAVIWGAGSKGVAYLSALGLDDGIQYAVDINPHKHGMFMAGTGQQIVAPEFLKDYQPELVIAMNPVYLGEIARDLRELDVPARLIAV